MTDVTTVDWLDEAAIADALRQAGHEDPARVRRWGGRPQAS
jgi:hypothetical protein